MNHKTKPKIVIRPWRITPRSRYVIVSTDGKRNICKVYNARGGKLESEAHGNAVLISKAPELFETLRGLTQALEQAEELIQAQREKAATYSDSEALQKLERLDVAYSRAKTLRLQFAIEQS